MENIINTPTPETQIIEPNFISPKPKTNYLNLILISFAFILFIVGAYYLGKQSAVVPVSNPVGILPQTTSVPTITVDSTTGWKTYQQNHFSFKYPSDFILQSEQRYDDRYQQDFIDTKNEYTLSIIEYPNFNQTTSKPYVDEEDFIGLNYPQDKVMIDDRKGIRVCPRAGCEDMFDVIFSADTKKSFYALSLQVGNHDQLVPVAKLQSGKQVFDQILSTFKFTESKEITPTKIQTTIKSIKYELPSNWLSVRDNSQLFEVGYNPTAQDIKMDKQSISIIYKNLNNNPYYSPYALTQLFQVLPYNNGSRHTFIEKQLGETINSGNKSPGYYESEMNIDGKSCLVLNGISISQFYTVWGMCAINTKQALLFTSFNYADLSQHLSSLKFKL